MKIRCSSLGKIMGCYPAPLTKAQLETYNAYKLRFDNLSGNERKLTDKQLITYADLMSKKNAVPTITPSAEKYANLLVLEKFYGRKLEVETNGLTKGKLCEEESVTTLSLNVGKMLDTRTERKSNEYLTGECDLIDEDIIYDIKTSYEFNTFPLLQERPTNSLYEWQLRGYMLLYEKPKAYLSYCLVDTPNKLINDELRKLDYRENIFDLGGNINEGKLDLAKDLIYKHIFTEQGLNNFIAESSNFKKSMFNDFKEIPYYLRTKIYKFERDFEKEKQIKVCCKLVLDYANTELERLKKEFENI